MRWPAILFVALTTLALTIATGRGCTDTSEGGHPAQRAESTESVHQR